MKRALRFRLNGKPTQIDTDDERKLLWVLRSELELTGAKYGCGAGLCGSCTVIVDGQAVHACQTPLKAVDGKDVLTIEGLAKDGVLHPLQRAFLEHVGYQCGYCTPGMILGAYALLRANPHPTRAAILAGMERHLCRCAAHQRIVAAVEAAAQGGKS